MSSFSLHSCLLLSFLHFFFNPNSLFTSHFLFLFYFPSSSFISYLPLLFSFLFICLLPQLYLFYLPDSLPSSSRLPFLPSLLPPSFTSSFLFPFSTSSFPPSLNSITLILWGNLNSLKIHMPDFLWYNCIQNQQYTLSIILQYVIQSYTL